jgi:hypothetical protein
LDTEIHGDAEIHRESIFAVFGRVTVQVPIDQYRITLIGRIILMADTIAFMGWMFNLGGINN